MLLGCRLSAQRETSVVITGASSGIGRACAISLANEGFRVFAGVRKHKDGESLRAESCGTIEPIELDVTKSATITRAVETVRVQLQDSGIYGLVNKLAEEGKAVLVISSEHQELFGLCDRILVMGEGELRGELMPDRYSEENLLSLAMTRRGTETQAGERQ